MGDQYDDEPLDAPDGSPAFFSTTSRVLDRQGEWIGEDVACDLETQSVLFPIALVLLLVPLESHDESINM